MNAKRTMPAPPNNLEKLKKGWLKSAKTAKETLCDKDNLDKFDDLYTEHKVDKSYGADEDGHYGESITKFLTIMKKLKKDEREVYCRAPPVCGA